MGQGERSLEKFNEQFERILGQIIPYVGCMEGFTPGSPNPRNVNALNALEQMLRNSLSSAGLGTLDAASLAKGIAKGGAIGMGIAIVIATMIAEAEISSIFPQLRLGSASLPAILNAINSSHGVKIYHYHLLTASAMPAAGATMYLASIFRSRSR